LYNAIGRTSSSKRQFGVLELMMVFITLIGAPWSIPYYSLREYSGASRLASLKFLSSQKTKSPSGGRLQAAMNLEK